MSDLYGSVEGGDMSCFLQVLLQNPSSSAAAADVLFSGGGAAAAGESSASFNFSDPGRFFAGDSDRVNPSSGCKEPEASDVATDRGRSRSFKRCRDAEVHNLSEKKRRSRINEKLKALQTLVPNSNKTDKASMLDEAIEYLKQLQLQVQCNGILDESANGNGDSSWFSHDGRMLTMRNGLSLHSGYTMGPLQPTLAPSVGLNLDDAPPIANRLTGSLLEDSDVFMQSTVLHPTSHNNNSTLPMPSTRNTNNRLGILLPSYGLLDHLASTKDICRDDTFSRLQFDVNRSGNTSSPGISL